MNVPTHAAFRRSVLLLLAAAVMAVGLDPAQAKSIQKQNFVDLLSHTDSIVVGTVSNRTDGFQQGLPYTEITVDVAQSIKGDHGRTYTFRQFGLIAPKHTGDGRVNLMVTPAGWPTYAKGERVMLFLHAPASETGFQTTAGLTLGKFSIRGSDIANGLDNDALFEDVRIDAPLSAELQDLVSRPGGAYRADAFLALVRQAVEENWIENGVMTDEN
jgi:hypothetical protein